MKIIIHQANGLQIGQRRLDGYINLTQMAKSQRQTDRRLFETRYY